MNDDDDRDLSHLIGHLAASYLIPAEAVITYIQALLGIDAIPHRLATEDRWFCGLEMAAAVLAGESDWAIDQIPGVWGAYAGRHRAGWDVDS